MILAFSVPLYYAALRRLEVWKLRTYMLTAPLMVAAIEWLLWGLEFSPTQCLGAALVLGGLMICIKIESRTHNLQYKIEQNTTPSPENIPQSRIIINETSQADKYM